MTAHHTHLCLVSAQATPTLLPLLDERWRPQRVVLACSPEMKNAANDLRNVIQTKSSGMQIDLLELPNAYAYDALIQVFEKFLDEHEAADVALNVTGGTKLMAVAAQEMFRAAGKAVFYVNAETDEIIRIGEKSAAQPLQAKLKVHEMLRAHGHQVVGQQQPQVTREQRGLTARLIDHVSSSGRALGVFNALARQARDNHLRVTLDAKQTGSSQLKEIIALFEDAHQLTQKGDALHFSSEAARAFANGGWLESHVYDCLQSLRAQHPGLSDVAQSVRVAFAKSRAQNDTKNDKNELDVVFLYRHTLHIIECKTANLDLIGATGENIATEALYKMESLLKLGGLRTRGMIVDYRDAFASSDANRQRAKEAGIAIVSGHQLRDLKGTLQRLWFSTRPGNPPTA